MYIFKVGDTEYKVRFGMNSFCDTDLLDTTNELMSIFTDGDENADTTAIFKKLFVCTRELLYVGFQKDNPVVSVQAAGNLLDEYIEETGEDGKKQSLLTVFTELAGELLNEGFLGDLLQQMSEAQATGQKVKKGKKA